MHGGRIILSWLSSHYGAQVFTPLKCVSLRPLGDAFCFQGHIDHCRDNRKTAANLLLSPGRNPHIDVFF